MMTSHSGISSIREDESDNLRYILISRSAVTLMLLAYYRRPSRQELKPLARREIETHCGRASRTGQLQI